MIRKYKDTDTESVVDIWHKASAVAHPFLTTDFLHSEADNIRSLYLPNTETWVAEKNGNIVGFISLMGNEVGALFVDPVFHGQKIGKLLMDITTQQHSTLVLDVFEKNSMGRRFYKRYGYREISEYVHEPTGQQVIRLSYTSI